MMGGTGVAVMCCRMVRIFHNVKDDTAMLASASGLDRNREAPALCFRIEAAVRKAVRE